jgi:hypothetical protein
MKKVAKTIGFLAAWHIKRLGRALLPFAGSNTA